MLTKRNNYAKHLHNQLCHRGQEGRTRCTVSEDEGTPGTWLGCLVKALGKNPEDVLCRGIWIELERQDGKLLMAFKTAWTPCYEVTQLMKTVFPSLQFFYKAEEPGCEVYLKNDAEGKYFPETEADGHPFDLMTEGSEQEQVRLIRAIQEGKIRLIPVK